MAPGQPTWVSVISLSRSPATRGMRGAGLATAVVSGTATIVIGLLPQLHASYQWSALHVALDTTATLIGLLAACLAVGRLWRHTLLNELLLLAALTVCALSALFFGTLPILGAAAVPRLTVWAALTASMLAALLFALAAFAPRRRLRQPAFLLAGGTVGITVAVMLAVVLAGALTTHAPAVGPHVPSDLGQQPVLIAPQIVMAVLYGLAAVGFLSRSQRLGDEFLGWLAIAVVLAAASRIDYALYPLFDSDSAYIGEVFRLLFFAVLFVGLMREIRSHWQAWSDAAVLEERRRVARDLHDGLAQELACMARNLDQPDEEIGDETLGQLRQAVGRAQVEYRQTIRVLASPDRQALEIALAKAASEITERFNVRLAFDSVPDVRLPKTRAEALVRIGCEAVANAAQHSGASLVRISLARDGQRVRLRVNDAGCGFNPDVRSSGFGLTSMRERADLVGGEVRITSTPGVGSEVEVVL
jgi:signal transduction histidine kinase